MLFNASEFEQYFSDALLLKKGLRLFERGLLEPEGRVGPNEFKFTVNAHYTLLLKKKGDKVMFYTCSCTKSTFCEHLCATLFYFQKDALGISVKKRVVKPKAAQGTSEIKNLGLFLKDIDQLSLAAFINEYAADHPLFKETVLAYFSSGSEQMAFNFYRIAVKNVLVSTAASEHLQQKELDTLCLRLDDLVAKQVKLKAGYRSLYYLRLAINTELPVIFNARLTGDETELVKWLEHNSTELDRFYFNNFSSSEKQAWLEAALQFLKNSPQVYAPVFSFMLPRAIALLKQKEDANELKKLLERKNLKLVRVAGNLNPLEIARLTLAIKEAELFKTPFPFKKYNEDPELIIAKAELYFCAGKADKAFSYLNENLDDTKSDFPKAFKAFADYVMLKAREQQQPEIELNYLEELFVYSLHISPKDLERFLELIPVKKQAAQLNALIDKIKAHSKGDEIDKISTILLKAGRLNDLVKELKHQTNKFNLVNKIAFQSLPDYTDELLAIYLQNLVNALFEARYTNYQQPLFLLAKKYFDCLPNKTANDVVAQLLKQIEFIKPLYNFIFGYYPHAMGIKAKNKIT